jgi:uncharacterized protein
MTALPLQCVPFFVNITGMDQTVVEHIRSVLPEVEAIYLFGSRARGQQSTTSDFDLAVLAPEPLAPVARFDLQEALASKLHSSVDLVDLRTASTVMRVQVIDGGRLLYERSPFLRQLFEATALSAYARLNEERRGIIDDVKARGSVHG